MAHRIDYRHEYDESAATRALWTAGMGFALVVLVLVMTAGSTRVASFERPLLPPLTVAVP